MLAPPSTFPRDVQVTPCLRGHTAGRDAANGTCKECRREASKRYYIKDRERRLKVGAKWRKANPDKIRTKGREYRKNNPKQTLLDSAKDRARTYGYLCTITIADIFIPEFCPLLGVKLVSGRGVGGAKASSPSLDRICPHLGYVPGNVWVISYRANMAKNDLTLLELQTLVTNLTARMQKMPWERE